MFIYMILLWFTCSFRCPLSTVEECKSGKVPMIGASKEYMKVLVKGLVEGKQFTQDDAIAYIDEAATKSL